MNPDPASLDNLQDIVEPQPVSWWPLAVGWWVLCAILAVATAYAAVRVWNAWRANAYRRAALRELQDAATTAEVAGILKRTALCAFPRSQVASLTGSAWSRWLGETAGVQISDSISRHLTTGVFGDGRSADISELASFAADWIRNHGNRTEAREGSIR